MTGTAIFLWHDGKSRYDEVIWDPKPITREQAAQLAVAKLRQDRRATRVQVAYSDMDFQEVSRPTRGHEPPGNAR